jgi:hypothetical protein
MVQWPPAAPFSTRNTASLSTTLLITQLTSARTWLPQGEPLPDDEDEYEGDEDEDEDGDEDDEDEDDEEGDAEEEGPPSGGVLAGCCAGVGWGCCAGGTGVECLSA